MTRERIKDFKEIVLPFFTNYLLKKNYENLGKSDAEEFEKDFKEIIELADKVLEQEPCEDAISRQAVLAIVGDSCLDLDNYEDTKEFCDEINDLPSVTPTRKKERWIPVSERLPEDDDDVIITAIFAGTLNKKGNMWLHKSDVTKEVFNAVAQYCLEHDEAMNFNYNGKRYRLAVTEQQYTEKEFDNEE